MPNKEAKTKEVREFRTELVKTISTLVISAFSLVAALAWNSAITKTIEKYLTPGSSIISWFIYALGVTILAVLVTLYLSGLTEKFKQEE